MQDARNESEEIANDYIQTRKKYGKNSIELKRWIKNNIKYACMTEKEMWNFFKSSSNN
jgi:hypothetical protein